MTQFKAMSFAMLDEEHKQPTSYKLVCAGKEEKVVGLHIIGEGSDEMLQGCELLFSLFDARHYVLRPAEEE
jgi:pyruvate/2-oxoglutarate dehydrogenase complex dihydrolipoamide dehydrogenase (E3) component